ncbi:hypothetical protein FHS77_003244 [Paenochrobactrum gallinarii]|uniref:UrcA family protein n=1 Tax=Paenochrobactrum gallinarii TaxID=643673 RepID=A0A841M1N3_9HYPH|nr:hypothetical protein [Paenochrobactrum gallinarii]MBB6262662.1 hypothetical protein [Paenochrobactrum gallinarii]
MRRFFISIFLLILFFRPAIADEKYEVCITDAMNRYLQLSLEPSRAGRVIVLSPENQILQRRTYENYCLEITACGLKNYKGENQDMVASALFSKCLDEENNG